MTAKPAELGPVSVIALLLLLGAVLRVAMGFESFWFDEAWSHRLATRANSAMALFDARHDNNHLLNSLYLRAVDGWVGRGHWIWFRIPSLLAGCLSLGLLWHLGRRFGTRVALVAVTLGATSFPLISASGQARGYALAILFSLTYVALASREPQKEKERREWGRCGALALTAAVGIASHATFAYALVAASIWSAARDRSVAAVLRRHGVPLATVAGFYVFFYADLEVGGGPSYDRFETLRQAFAQTMALPRRGPLTWVATGLGVGLAFWALFRLRRQPDRSAVFFAAVIFVVPGAIILFRDPQLLYARYLLAAFPWFYLLIAIGLSDAWDRGIGMRLAAALVLTFFVGSNLLHTGRVLSEGRNDYLKTLAYIDRYTTGPTLRIGSDHDFRNRMVLRFYAPRIASGRPIEYIEADNWEDAGPEWYLRHDWQSGHDPEARFSPKRGVAFEQVVAFEHGPGDGFQWFVYRRINPRALLDAP